MTLYSCSPGSYHPTDRKKLLTSFPLGSIFSKISHKQKWGRKLWIYKAVVLLGFLGFSWRRSLLRESLIITTVTAGWHLVLYNLLQWEYMGSSKSFETNPAMVSKIKVCLSLAAGYRKLGWCPAQHSPPEL